MSARANATTATPLARLRAGWAVAPQLLLFVLTLLLYLATLTQVHTFDALSYVTSVERKPWTEVFHPHHLAYGPLGALAHRVLVRRDVERIFDYRAQAVPARLTSP